MPMSSQAARAKREAERAHRPTRKPDFDAGYLKTPNAAVWQGAPAAPTARPPRNIRWAKTPHPTAWGVCLAIELRADGSFAVCVERRDGVRAWLPWEEVVCLAGVQEWSQRGF